MKGTATRKILSLLIVFTLIFQQAGFAQVLGQLDISKYLNQINAFSNPNKFRPLQLRYFSYDPITNDFQILLDKGDLKELTDKQIKEQGQELLKYFLVGIALPDESFWVNLRPDSENQIIDQELTRTDLGKVLLEADLQLKKDVARFTSPETPTGREYWNKLYAKAGEIFNSENITIPTLTRPWIVPGEVIIRETAQSAYVYKATLKVMLEQDHLKDSADYNFNDPRLKELNEYSAQLVRQIIIPQLTKEVNSSSKYASLRQVFNSLILARWFKSRFTGKNGAYPKLINTGNLNGLASKSAWSKTTYFKEYQKSFSSGEYNIKEQVNTVLGPTIRTYFSGGVALNGQELNMPRTLNPASRLATFTGSSPIIANALRNGMAAVNGNAASGEIRQATQTGKASSPVELVDQAGQVANRFNYSGKEQAGAIVLHPSPEAFARAFIQLNPAFQNGSIPVICEEPVIFDPTKDMVCREISMFLETMVNRHKGNVNVIIVPLVVRSRLQGSNYDADGFAGFLRSQRMLSPTVYLVTIFGERTDFEYFLSLGESYSHQDPTHSRQYHVEFIRYEPGTPMKKAIAQGARIFDFTQTSSPVGNRVVSIADLFEKARHRDDIDAFRELVRIAKIYGGSITPEIKDWLAMKTTAVDGTVRSLAFEAIGVLNDPDNNTTMRLGYWLTDGELFEIVKKLENTDALYDLLYRIKKDPGSFSANPEIKSWLAPMTTAVDDTVRRLALEAMQALEVARKNKGEGASSPLEQAQAHLNFADTQAVNNALQGIVEITPQGVRVVDEEALRDDLVDKLVYDATFNPDKSIVDLSRKLIRQIAAAKGATLASVYPFYRNKTTDSSNFTYPAINIRFMTFDTARAIFGSALRKRVTRPVIFEIAKSEIGYTGQRPAEYTTSVLAAAIKEGWNQPVYLQGDHFQMAAKDYLANPDNAREAIKQLIREAIEAGFYQIDLDMSTLVDWSKPTANEQQRTNYTETATLTAFVRGLERELGLDKLGIVVNLGGEIGEIGMGLEKGKERNSTVEDLRAFMDGYRAVLGALSQKTLYELKPITKVAVQSGTKHGGIRDAQGNPVGKVKVGFNTLAELGKVAREEYGLAGVVQHGASTLPPDYFTVFAGKDAPGGASIDTTLLSPEGQQILRLHPVAEVHLATAYQDTTLDHPALPEDLRSAINEFILGKYPLKEGQDPLKALAENRKNAAGPYKLYLWNLPEETKAPIRDSLGAQFDTVFNNLGVADQAASSPLTAVQQLASNAIDSQGYKQGVSGIREFRVYWISKKATISRNKFMLSILNSGIKRYFTQLKGAIEEAFGSKITPVISGYLDNLQKKVDDSDFEAQRDSQNAIDAQLLVIDRALDQLDRYLSELAGRPSSPAANSPVTITELLSQHRKRDGNWLDEQLTIPQIGEWARRLSESAFSFPDLNAAVPILREVANSRLLGMRREEVIEAVNRGTEYITGSISAAAAILYLRQQQIRKRNSLPLNAEQQLAAGKAIESRDYKEGVWGIRELLMKWTREKVIISRNNAMLVELSSEVKAHFAELKEAIEAVYGGGMPLVIRRYLDALGREVSDSNFAAPRDSQNAVDAQLLVLDRALDDLDRYLSALAGSPSASSPTVPNRPGGIDFRAIPMITQPMGNLAGLSFNLPKLSNLQNINLETELNQIQGMVRAGIIPSGDRLKEYIAACYQKGELQQHLDGIVACLVDICKLEEEQVSESQSALKEALVIIDAI